VDPANPLERVAFRRLGDASEGFREVCLALNALDDNIDVLRQPLEKLPTQYLEERRYFSANEDSQYHLTLRFNRVA
jgi:hypothetical protein